VLEALSDVGYAPPAFTSIDDGVTFPLERSQAVVFEQLHGTLAAQTTAVNAGLAAARRQAQQQARTAATFIQSISDQQAAAAAGQVTVESLLKQAPIWYELDLANLTGGPYSAEYFIGTTPLVVPTGIDLAAESTA